MSNTIKLEINSNIRPIRKIDLINPRKIRKRILAQGYERLILIGIPIKKCLLGVGLWVELDVDFIIESCQHLEELILSHEKFEHYSCLNDGLLVTETSINSEIAKVTYRYCPGLNEYNLVGNTKKMSKKEYSWQWRNLTYDLLDIAKK